MSVRDDEPRTVTGGASVELGAAGVQKLPARLGRYVLQRRLGAGGMAEVFLAEQDGPAGFRRPCVVKRILPHLAEQPKFVEMFQREALVAGLLTHTNIVQVFELGEVDGSFFIAMEHVDGATLDVVARSAWTRGRPLPLELVCCAVADAALGLDHAHRLVDRTGAPLSLVHRDISPDNLMLNREGITKVLDFGVAKSALSSTTTTGEVRGKLPYLSPEQLLNLPVDGRSDLYSLGVTLYWLLTGRRPLTAMHDVALLQKIVSEPPTPPRALNPRVPAVVNDLTMRLLEKDRARRPSTGAEVHDVLAGALKARRAVVVPFVLDVCASPVAGDDDDDVKTTTGFLHATARDEGLFAPTTGSPTPTPTTPTTTRPPSARFSPPAATGPATPSSARVLTLPPTPARTPIDATDGQRAAKGVVLAPMVAALKRAMKDKGLDVVAGLLPGDLEAVRYARILATGYYSLDFYHRVAIAAHEHAWGGGEAGARQMGFDAAMDALKGHYVAFLREGDPARTLSAAPRLWAAHYRGSTSEVTPLGTAGIRIHVRGYGPMPPVLQVINRSWAEACVKITGGSDIRSTSSDGPDGFVVEVFWAPMRR